MSLSHLLVREGPEKAWELFKRVPGGRGFVLTKYQPVGTHGDPIQKQISAFVET